MFISFSSNVTAHAGFQFLALLLTLVKLPSIIGVAFDFSRIEPGVPKI